MDYYNKLIDPLYKRVNEIKESLCLKTFISAGDEKMIYGTFEKTFETYSKQSLRAGNRVNEIDYFNSIIKELEQIEDAVLQIEKRIDKEQNNSIQFHGIISIIHSTKQETKECIKNFEVINTPKVKAYKTRNIKSKLTYKWIIDEAKLYDFKRSLTKSELIEKIDFQDFKIIFSELPLTEIKNKIVWKNEIATQLIYFINELQIAGFIEIKRKTFDYVLLYQCFQKNNRVEFTEKSKSLKNNMDIKVDSEYKELVKNILSQLGQ